MCTKNKPPCPPHMFTCKSDNQCIPEYFGKFRLFIMWCCVINFEFSTPPLACDFDNDCSDGSDEQNCKTPSCKPDEFVCKNGRCLSKKWVCDGEDDCRDNSDELNCTPTNKTATTCRPDEYRCKSTGSCIPNQWRCDSDKDCTDGSDEMNCVNTTCEPWMFSCGDGHCIYKTWVCDGEKDCKDGGDETNCTTIVEPPKPGISFPSDENCHDWMFKCSNAKCVPYWWKCDGVNDCGDGSDEQGCGNVTNAISTSTTQKPVSPTVNKHCRPNEFRCDAGACILKRYVCDGYNDCAKGEDEQNCPTNRSCATGEFRCRIDGKCLPMEKYCDNIVDCLDGSDEDCKNKMNM
jgi:sortilin-related receptor